MKLLRFSAEWCEPCKRLGPLFDSIAERAGLPVELVDVDESPGLAASHNIRSVPAVVLIKDGAPVYTGAGSSALSGLQTALDSL